jgi:hypothetical protein
MHSQSSETSGVRQLVGERWLLLLVVLAVPIVECLARIQGGPGPSLALVRNPFAAIAAASVFCRYFIDDFRGRTRRWVVYLTPLTWLAALAVEGRGAPPALLWLDMLFGLGVLGAFGFLLAARVATDPAVKSRYVGQLMDALLLPLGASMVSYGLWATTRLNPVYDGRIYAFEEILGVKFSLLGVASYRMLRPLSGIATACYSLLAVGIVLVAAAQRHPRREQDVLAATLVAGACGFALYFVCPVAGPLTAFGPLYPAALPAPPVDMALITATVGAPRNGMPSLHTIWALLVWFNAQSLPAGPRRGLRSFSLLTLWAAMGLDDTHWFMDVVVGVPLAVAIQAGVVTRGFEAASRTWVTVLVCAAAAAAWLAGFRAGTPLLALPPIAAWAAVAVTLAWPLSRCRQGAFEYQPAAVRDRLPVPEDAEAC